MGGDEDNWNRLPPACQFLLQVGSRHADHRDVENEALGLANELRREERLGRRECLGGETELSQQVWQRLALGLVIVDDRHEGTLDHHEFLTASAASVVRSGTRGMEKANVAPGPSFGSAHRRPPCSSMMERLTDRPMPMPLLLVV